MASISTIILYLTAIVFTFGQLLRLDIKGISFPLIDIFIFAIFIFNIFDKVKNKKFTIKNKFLFYFVIFAWVSFGINLIHYQIPSLTPLLYLCRLTCLLSFFIYPLDIKNIKFQSFFLITIISNIVFGFIQYFFWPDFTFFNSLNWDPHLFRLVSSFFDPTFTAFIYLMFLIYVFLKPKFPFRIPLLIISYLALALTYSRSSYIAFLLAFSFISFKKKNIKIFIFSLVLILLTTFTLPREQGEGTKLERTSSIFAKVENYKEAISVFAKAPLIGHGYDNLYFVRSIQNPASHANYGFDSSLMTILTTTGIIGLILFIFGLKTYYFQSDLTHQTIMLALLIHSLFANSLLYPWILLFLVFTQKPIDYK